MSPVRRPTLLFPILLLLLAALLAAGCGDSGESDNAGSGDSDTSEIEGGDDADSGEDGATDDVAARNDSYDEAPKQRLDPDTTYVVTMETSEGSFDIELDQEAAPIAAANFAFLVGEGYYDGIVFHRIIKDFMVQAGDPTGTGTGGPGYSLKDDPVKGSYTRGTVAMANAGPDTGGSQFFIVHGTEVDQQLGKDYVIFGEVDKEGMETVDKIADVEVEAGPTGEPSQPVETVRIEEATLAER